MAIPNATHIIAASGPNKPQINKSGPDIAIVLIPSTITYPHVVNCTFTAHILVAAFYIKTPSFCPSMPCSIRNC